MNDFRERQEVNGAPIDVIYWRGAVATLLRWAAARESRYVCACNVHSVVTAQHDRRLAAAVRCADMALPDGAPVAWLMRRSGFESQRRVAGPDLMWQYFSAAAPYRESVFLMGSSPEILVRLKERINATFPGLSVAGTLSPPYRSLSPQEDAEVVRAINDSGASTVWIALGCPKQEIWMAENRHRVRAVMIGVGAAFAFHAGVTRRAPLWMQRLSLEWLFRLVSEPARLWRRYLTTNSLFLWAVARQLLRR